MLKMKLRRVLWVVFKVVAALVLLLAILVGCVWIYFHPSFQRTDGIVYGHRDGHDLTIDILKPSKPNGVGVMLIVSGGWKSGTNSFRAWMVAPLLRHGYTVFPIFHLSQPQDTVQEINEDINHAVRFIRYHAHEYGIDPKRLGVTGGSAGGHLSLMLVTRGGPGPADATNAVDRESSAVQAAAIFYPVTDLLNLGNSTENLHNGGPPKSFMKSFGPNATNPAVWKVIGRNLSPIDFVHSNMAPTLIYHGDADTLVPLDQSQRYQAAAKKLGCIVKLVIHHGGHHGWLSMVWDIQKFADWFDKYLLKPKK